MFDGGNLLGWVIGLAVVAVCVVIAPWLDMADDELSERLSRVDQDIDAHAKGIR